MHLPDWLKVYFLVSWNTVFWWWLWSCSHGTVVASGLINMKGLPCARLGRSFLSFSSGLCFKIITISYRHVEGITHLSSRAHFSAGLSIGIVAGNTPSYRSQFSTEEWWLFSDSGPLCAVTSSISIITYPFRIQVYLLTGKQNNLTSETTNSVD